MKLMQNTADDYGELDVLFSSEPNVMELDDISTASDVSVNMQNSEKINVQVQVQVQADNRVSRIDNISKLYKVENISNNLNKRGRYRKYNKDESIDRKRYINKMYSRKNRAIQKQKYLEMVKYSQRLLDNNNKLRDNIILLHL
jgi:hypothetical protein